MYQSFHCIYDLSDEIMEWFLGFARFVTYEADETSPLYLAKSKKAESYLNKQKAKGRNIDNEKDQKL